MARKILQDIANTLPAMLVGWRMASDLEALACLPDGELEIDLLAVESRHSSGTAVTLHIAEELASWMQSRFAVHHLSAGEVTFAQLTAQIRTDKIATDRKRIISFSFVCRSLLRTADREYVGELSESHTWHTRGAQC